MGNAGVSPDSPLLYLFVAATLILVAGYLRGARVNKRLAPAVFDILVRAVKAREKRFTNIGGLTGYHATLVPKKRKVVESVNATLVLLPRQSLLFLPIALLMGHRDTLAVFLNLAEEPAGRLSEGHLVDTTSRAARRTTIEGVENLATETIVWGGRPFLLHSADRHAADRLKTLTTRLPDPGPLRHLALVPSRNRIFFTMQANPARVERIVGELLAVDRWLGVGR
jgi:hypothetical protein